MDDFKIKIGSQLDLENAKSQLQKFLSSHNKEKLKIDVELNNDLLKGLTKEFETAGKNASSAFNKGFTLSKSPSIKEFTNFQKSILDQTKATEKKMNNILGNSVEGKTQAKWADTYVKNQQKEIQKALREVEKIENIKQKVLNSSTNLNSLKILTTEGGSKKYGDDGYKKLTFQISAAENALEKFNTEIAKGDNANLDRLNSDMKEFISLVNKANREQYRLSENISFQKQTLALKDLDRYWNSNTKAHKDFEGVYEHYRSILSNEKLTIGQFEDASFGIKSMKKDIEIAGKSGKSFLDELSRGFRQISQFVGTYGILQNLSQELPRQIIQSVRDINEAQIELMKVSNAPTNELNDYWDEAAESAKKYGATVNEVINNTADWTRLGYNLDDAKKLSDATTLLKTVGDNMTQESSSSGLISTLKGFKLQAEEAESIVDKINEVANTQPIDTSGLFAGLERSASSMNTANNTLEETISLITAANSVVQDPAKIGNGLKTISMRLRGATTELEEAGLDTEGMVESTSKLREEIMALSGVDIMLDNSTFKSTYQILDELSDKWSSLSDIQQASITELVAGKHQGNTMSALMGQFDIARKTLDTAMNKSSGSASRELDNYNKGIEASIGRFKATFQELSTTLLSSDLFKGLVDGGTAFVSVLEKIIDVGGGIPTLLAGIGGIAFFKNLD